MRFDLDRPLQLAKRARRRLLFADYHDTDRRHRWLAEPPCAPYTERVLPVRVDPRDVASILVFKPDEMGDAVYALPAVAALRRAFPHARLSLLCQPLTEPVYARSGLFDEIVAVAPTTRLTRPRIDVAGAMARFDAEAFDVGVFLRTYPAYFKDFLDVPSAIKVHPVDPAMRSDSVHRAQVSLWTEQRAHQSLQLLEIAGRLTGREYSFDDVRFPGFEWTDADRAPVDELLGAPDDGPVIVVHPFVKHETRRYPMEYWTVLLERLRAAVPGRWVVVGGPGDPQLDDAAGLMQTQGELSLGQTGNLLSRADAFIGILSGPAHWAAAMGTPTVTLMSGHSLPAEWAPLGRSLVMRADVPCAPCHQRTCPVYGLACLTEMRPERIAPEVEAFMRSAVAERVPLGE